MKSRAPARFVPIATRNPGLAHGLRRLERRLTPIALALGVAELAGMTNRKLAS